MIEGNFLYLSLYKFIRSFHTSLITSALLNSLSKLWSNTIIIEFDVKVKYMATCHPKTTSLLQSLYHQVLMKSSSKELGL